jgi:hypothetical protein
MSLLVNILGSVYLILLPVFPLLFDQCSILISDETRSRLDVTAFLLLEPIFVDIRHHLTSTNLFDHFPSLLWR